MLKTVGARLPSRPSRLVGVNRQADPLPVRGQVKFEDVGLSAAGELSPKPRQPARCEGGAYVEFQRITSSEAGTRVRRQ